MVNRKIKIITHSPEETRNLGKIVGQKIIQPLVIALTGDLGSGKTVFVQGLAKGLEVPSDYYITSPTFTLVNEYPGRYPLVHADLYRLEHIDELEDIGLDELLYDQAVIAIEWVEKLADNLPASHLSLTFEIIDDGNRKVSLLAYGHREVNLIKSIENQFLTEKK